MFFSIKYWKLILKILVPWVNIINSRHDKKKSFFELEDYYIRRSFKKSELHNVITNSRLYSAQPKNISKKRLPEKVSFSQFFFDLLFRQKIFPESSSGLGRTGVLLLIAMPNFFSHPCLDKIKFVFRPNDVFDSKSGTECMKRTKVRLQEHDKIAEQENRSLPSFN